MTPGYNSTLDLRPEKKMVSIFLFPFLLPFFPLSLYKITFPKGRGKNLYVPYEAAYLLLD